MQLTQVISFQKKKEKKSNFVYFWLPFFSVHLDKVALPKKKEKEKNTITFFGLQQFPI